MSATNPNQSRVAAGVPTGGQFAASAKAEAGVALAETEEWLPPGAHQVVECLRCAADDARRDDPGCRFCDRGKVTTDRYGQRPWHPEAPGTKVGFQSRRNGEDHKWVSATITASQAPGESEFFALGLDADNQAMPVYLHSAIPLAAAQAAARHGVSKAEMIEEAAHDMHIGIDPSHDEVRAFLDRIDEGYLEDLGSAAARHRVYAAAELRAEGKTGPALDTDFDTSALRPGAIDKAIENANASFHSQFEVTGREHWHGYTLVATPDGRVATYDDTAWDRPDEAPMLPWSPPKGTPIAHVALDGTVTRVDQAAGTSAFDQAWERYFAFHTDVVASWGHQNGRMPNCPDDCGCRA